LGQFQDPLLPDAWKIGLLDTLNLENRSDLSESDVSAVIDAFAVKGTAGQTEQAFNFFCLRWFGSFLFSQKELVGQREPKVKRALEKQDRAALPKRDDANIRQAAKLIDAIHNYKAALQKTADEMKDEKIKANLNKRILKWEPAPDTPTK
jgi:hypothetical protein